jgi:hypothetical protein
MEGTGGGCGCSRMRKIFSARKIYDNTGMRSGEALTASEPDRVELPLGSRLVIGEPNAGLQLLSPVPSARGYDYLGVIIWAGHIAGGVG